jgi:hypothetical protein
MFEGRNAFADGGDEGSRCPAAFTLKSEAFCLPSSFGAGETLFPNLKL